DDDGEPVLAACEVGRTVERIDDPAALAWPRDQVDEVWLVLDRLLAHDRYARQDLGQPGGEPLFGRDVGYGDEVTRPFEPDVFLGERAKARQQLCRCRLAHQLGDTFRIGRAQ